MLVKNKTQRQKKSFHNSDRQKDNLLKFNTQMPTILEVLNSTNSKKHSLKKLHKITRTLRESIEK